MLFYINSSLFLTLKIFTKLLLSNICLSSFIPLALTAGNIAAGAFISKTSLAYMRPIIRCKWLCSFRIYRENCVKPASNTGIMVKTWI